MQRRTFSQTLRFLGWLYAMWGSLFDDFGVLLQPWSSKVPPGTPQGRLRDETATKLAALRDHCALFWTPGPPKKSIVANLAPKMTPKWRSKWSQLQDCGPSPNMRLHGPIAYWTPPWGAIFPPLLRGHQKLMKKSGNKARFRKKRVPNLKKAPRHSGKEQNCFFWSPKEIFQSRKRVKMGSNGTVTEKGPPQGGSNMLSVHASACFVRVGSVSKASILTPFLSHFGSQDSHYTLLGGPWEPKKWVQSVSSGKALKTRAKCFFQETPGNFPEAIVCNPLMQAHVSWRFTNF